MHLQRHKGIVIRLTKYDPYFPVSTLQEMLFGCLQGLFEGAPNRERRSMKQGDRKVYCKKVDPSLYQPT